MVFTIQVSSWAGIWSKFVRMSVFTMRHLVWKKAHQLGALGRDMCFLCLLMVCTSLLVMGPTGNRAAAQSSNDILITKHSAHFYVSKDGLPFASGSVAAHTLLEVLPSALPKAGVPRSMDQTFFPARTLIPKDRDRGWVPGIDRGWIREADVLNVSALSRGLLLARRKETPLEPQEEQDLPALIQRQPETVQRAYRDIQAAVKQNEQLAQPMPDPYLARAQLWALLDNHEAALSDYLKGSSVVVGSKENLVEYARHFLRLVDALRNREEVPRQPFYGDAWGHYAKGYHAYWAGDLERAQQHFDDAIQLGPKSAVFWYYRALTNKRLGNESRAKGDVVMAVGLENELDDPTRIDEILTRGRRTNPVISEQLSRVQGALRIWLEEYRTGVAAFSRQRSKWKK